jgi:hypothetical protein
MTPARTVHSRSGPATLAPPSDANGPQNGGELPPHIRENRQNCCTRNGQQALQKKLPNAGSPEKIFQAGRIRHPA